jgi:16S rRNA processing protein RimM
MSKTDLLILGRVTSAFGLKGEIKVFYHGSDSRLLSGLEHIWLGAEPAAAAAYTLRQFRSYKGRLLLSLGGVEDRNQALALAGQWLLVKKNDLPPLGEDEFYLAELKGMEVRDSQGQCLGQVHSLAGGGAQELLEIRNQHGHKALLPLVRPLLRELDLEKRLIVFDLPSGLLQAQGWPENEQP